MTFHLLEQEIVEFTDHPTGAGLDTPTWLQALDDEAQVVLAQPGAGESCGERESFVEWAEIDPAEIHQQIRSWDENE